MSDVISVIIPVYNTGQFLVRCVNSVLNQDYPHLEIIIVDDGSSDGHTPSLCDSLAEESYRITVYHKDNGGLSSARNYGIKRAHGHYVGFVDSDDVIEPNMYSSLYRDLISHKVRVSICNLATEDNGHLIDKLETIPGGEYNNTELLHFFFLGHWHSACTNLYEKSLFDSVLFPEGEINEDYMLNYLVYKEQEKIYYNSATYYHYVRRQGSITSSPVSLAFIDWIKHTSLVRDEYKDHPELSGEAEYQYLYSNIILGNKCLLSLGKSQSPDAEQLYRIVTRNLKQERKRVLTNRYLSNRYRLFGALLSYVPHFYKTAAIPFIHVYKQ